MNRGFERELDELQHGFKRFASQFPALASSLDLFNKEGSSDPDVRYLMEAFCRITHDLSTQIEKASIAILMHCYVKHTAYGQRPYHHPQLFRSNYLTKRKSGQ